MKAVETQTNAGTGANPKLSVSQKHGRGQYQKVFDARKRRLRRNWERNCAFYGQLTFANQKTGAKAVRRLRLEGRDGNPVNTIPQAVAGLNKMKGQREDDKLKVAV